MASKRKRTLIQRKARVALKVRMSVALHRELKRIAKGNRTSVNAEVLRRLAYGGEPVERDQQFVWMVHTIQMIWERLYGEQAQARPAAQNGPAPPQRPSETGGG